MKNGEKKYTHTQKHKNRICKMNSNWSAAYVFNWMMQE